MRIRRPVRRGRISLGNGICLSSCQLLSSTPFTPLSLSPALWLKADAGLYQETSSPSTLSSADGDPVGTWQDQSGNARHATAPTSGKRPTLKLAIQNGMPAILWDGVDDALLTSAFQTFPSKRGSMFVVFRNTWAGEYRGVLATYPSVSPGWYWYSDASVPGYKFKWFDGVTPLTAPSSDTTSWNVQSLIRDGDTSLKFRRNGSAIATLSIANNQPASGAVGIGADGSGANALAGYIGEILIFDTALSGADLTNVEAYLNTRWSVY